MNANSINGHALLSTLVDKAERNAVITQTNTAATGSLASTASPVDATNLSGTASVLSASATTTGDVRAAKVAALKSAIDSGTYNVPATAVADKLMQSMLE